MKSCAAFVCIAAALPFLWCAPAACGENTNIIQDGKSDYVICLVQDPDPAEEFAATELQDYLARISGCKLPIKIWDWAPQSIV